MCLSKGKHNGFAGVLSGGVPQANLQYFLPLTPDGIPVADFLFQLGTFVIQRIRVNALFNQAVALHFRQIHTVNTKVLVACAGRIMVVIHQVALVNCLTVGVEVRGGAIIAAESKECIPVNELRRSGGQTNHPGIEVLNHFVVLVKDRTMNFVKDNQIKECRGKLLETVAEGLQGGSIKPVGFFNSMTVNARAGFVGDECLKPIGLGLLHQSIPVRHKQDSPRLIGAHEYINQGHGGAGLAGAGCHHNQRLAFARRKCFTHPADGFVLVSAIRNRIVDWNGFQWQPILPNIEQVFQVFRGEETIDRTFRSKSIIIKIGVNPIGEENKWAKTLMALNFFSIHFRLGLRQLDIVRCPLGFHHGNHLTSFAVKAVICKSVKRSSIIIGNRHLKTHLLMIMQVPACCFQSRINQFLPGLLFIDSTYHLQSSMSLIND